ncbi:MAG: maleylpyruvate isomerase family mycothiol-dependent enzyme [Nocardioidaceae bacterium]
MRLTTTDCTDAIATHSRGFAEAARRADPRTRIEKCPDWDVADLVWHLSEVHWFWATIARDLLDAPPDDTLRPPRPADEGLIDAFEAGADRLVTVLGAADQTAACWTWAGWQQNVAFITRHQVQEAAVHHWDAAHAAGLPMSIAPEVAVDSIDEFLSFSVPSPEDPDDPPGGSLGGTLLLRATDTGDGWRVRDDERPGTLSWESDPSPGPAVEGTASDLLLWLYGRVELAQPEPELIDRFRALTFTD